MNDNSITHEDGWLNDAVKREHSESVCGWGE